MEYFTKQHKEKITLFFLFMIAFLVRIYDSNSYSLWFDEALNFRIISLPWDKLWISNFDPTPPLYYSLLKLYINSTTPEVYLRLPSIIFGSASVLVFYYICKLKFSKTSALLTSILFSLSVHHVEYSQEARVYAMALFFGLCILYFALSVIFNKASRHKAIYLYALFSVLGLYSHNITVYYVLGANILVISFFIKEKEIRDLRNWILINSLVFLIWLPWPLVTVLSDEGNSFNWLSHISFFQFIASTVGSLTISPYPSRLLYWDMLFFIFVIFSLFFALKRKDKSFLFSIIVFSFSSIFLVWLTGYIKPIFMARTILMASPLVYLLIPYLFESLSNKLVLLCSTILILIHVFCLHAYYKNNFSENEQWKQVVSEVISVKDQNILMCSRSPSFAINYYLKNPDILEFSLINNDLEIQEVSSNLAKVMESYNGSNGLLEPKRPIAHADGAILIDSHCSETKLNLVKSNFNLKELKVGVYKKIDLYELSLKKVTRSFK